MILLYKDPKGAQVGTTLQITTDATQTGSGGTEMTKVNLELESKVASLEKLITELRNENETLKVSDSNSASVHLKNILDIHDACDGSHSAIIPKAS